ncbi:MAG TPA: cell division protein FtsQ/DivIB [Casimicrobiaceae bacterium]
MWDDARALNAVALLLAGVAFAFLIWGAVAWLVRQPAFAIRDVVITTPLARASGAHLESIVREELAGTFFTLDIERARRALGGVPWVRGIALRRQWPHRLEIAVEEQTPFARWNESSLVNAAGEVFVADWNGDLPQFNGPDGQSQTMAGRYREFAAALEPLALAVRGLTMSPRGGWQIAAAGSGGALTLDLGRDDPSGRLARFVAAHERTIGALARAGRWVEQVDLRYRNGFAARVPGFRERPAKKS